MKRENYLIANRLIVGDCVEALARFPKDCIDLTVTSPPYDKLRNYEGYDFDAERVARALLEVTKPGGVVVWVVGEHINGGRSMSSFEQALIFRDVGFTVHDVMIYQKKNTPFTRSNAYTNAWEFMFIFSKGGPPKTFHPLKVPTVRSGEELLTHNKLPDGINKKKTGRLNEEKTRTNIWPYAVGLGGTTRDKIAFQHPAVFPEKLAEDHILSWSNPGDLVLDPMCGSGTTCKMAMLNNRQYIGIDISDTYIHICEERLADAQSQLPAEVMYGLQERRLSFNHYGEGVGGR